MKYEVGDLLVAKNPHWEQANMYMVKKIIDINRCMDNGVWMETVQGYRVANLDNLDHTFVVSEDQMNERYTLATKQNLGVQNARNSLYSRNARKTPIL